MVNYQTNVCFVVLYTVPLLKKCKFFSGT